MDHPSLDLQLESSHSAMLRKELEEKTQELRLMKGEELHGLSIEELMHLEKLVEGGLRRVLDAKGEKILTELNALKMKGGLLMEENQSLKEKVRPFVDHHQEIGIAALQQAKSKAPQDNDRSDTSLRLGLPFPG